jgi:hypothetical protein
MLEQYLDQIAIAGYSLLFAFAAYKLADTIAHPVDLLANILLLIGLFCLIFYHAYALKTKKDETDDVLQKKVRIVAHTSMSAFFLMTLAPATVSVFQFYDVFGLVAHMYLLFAVAMKKSKLFGLFLLMMYFAVASFRSAQRFSINRVEILNALGRFVLLMFFTVAVINGFIALNKPQRFQSELFAEDTEGFEDTEDIEGFEDTEDTEGFEDTEDIEDFEDTEDTEDFEDTEDTEDFEDTEDTEGFFNHPKPKQA